MDIMTFKDRVRDYMLEALSSASISGVEVIHGHQPRRESDTPAAPTPPRPFVSLEIGNRDHVGQDDRQMRGETLEFNGDRAQTVTVRVYGTPSTEARDITDAIETGFEKPRVYDSLREHDIGVQSIPNVIGQDDVRGKGWQNRAQLDITFTFGDDYSTEPGVIDEAQITGTVEPGSNTDTVTATIS